MTPRERSLVARLVVSPGEGRDASPEEVLRQLGVTDGGAWALDQLSRAETEEDATDVEYALVAGAVYGLPQVAADLLARLVTAPWHRRHEDVVSALGEMRSISAIPALLDAARWVPEHLAYDDARALARKAVWALGAIPGHEATEALSSLAESPSEVVRSEVAHQLRRRAGG